MSIGTWKRAGVAAGLLAAIAGFGAPARAQGAPPAAAPVGDAAAFEAAKRAFERLPEAERKAIQDALVWTGDHTSVASGEFGRATFGAIQGYQRRLRQPPTGVLEPPVRAALLRQGREAKAAAGFKLVTDERTGAQIGVPEALLTKRAATPSGGSRWQSTDDAITLDTRAYPAGETDLPALFERITGAQVQGRQITYKVLRPDYFVVAGETAGGRFYMRYGAGPEGLRGFSVGYDKALQSFDKMVVAIANGFVAYPEAAAVAAVPSSPPQRPAAAPGASSGTGLVVAPRRVLTSAAVEACGDLRAGGLRAKLGPVDREAGLALLELERERPAPPVPLRPGAPPAEAPVVVLATGGDAPFTATAGEATGARLTAPLQPGAAGAPVFDRTGALVGLVRAYPAAPRLVAGVAPPMSHPLAGGEALARFLAGAGIAPASAAAGADRSAGEIAAAMGQSVVPVTCGR